MPVGSERGDSQERERVESAEPPDRASLKRTLPPGRSTRMAKSRRAELVLKPARTLLPASRSVNTKCRCGAPGTKKPGNESRAQK
jgi:hypothetical protein